MTEIAIAAFWNVLAVFPVLIDAPSDPFVRFELPGGVRLAVLHVPDAPRQSTFTFLPTGLASDPAGRAQFSHLAEHMLIRSTDPDSLEPSGLEINGETTADVVRLDTYAEPSAWRASLARHVRWLMADACDDAVLEREKGRIAGEEGATVASGFTHKWAEAAWNQVVRHGREHATVHGDVSGANAALVEEWIRESVLAGREVLIASVGPIAPADVRDALSAEFQAVLPELEPRRESARDRERETSGGDDGDGPRASTGRATWDLDAHQYLEWYRVPKNAVDRVAGHALAQLVNFELGRSTSSGLGSGKVLARIVRTPEGCYLLMSASLASAADEGLARDAFAAARIGARGGAGMTLKVALFQLAAQATSLPDPQASRRALASLGRDASLVEAQLALNFLALEIGLGLDRAEIQSAWRELDVEGMEAFIETVLVDANRSSLSLAPRR